MGFTTRLILVLFGLAYLISPADLIPDLLVPWVGWLDDGAVIWCLYYLLRFGKLPWFPGSQKRAGTGNARAGQSGQGQKSRQSRGKNQSRTSSARPARGAGKGLAHGSKADTSPYEILGVARNAGFDQIQKAYKEKIKQYHPDKLSHLGEEFAHLANQKFLEIQHAFETLEQKHRKK